MRLLILFTFLLSVSGEAEIIPSYRRITWQDRVGIPGGIPNRTTIYTNLPAGVSTATAQAALNNCPSNQVVQLATGSYAWTGVIIPTGVTLRGTGTNTIIVADTGGTDDAVVFFGDNCRTCWPEFPTTTSVTSGTSDGSVSIVVSSATGFNIGGLFAIDELNDTNFVTTYGDPGAGNLIADQAANGNNGWPSGGQDRLRGQVCLITNISGTTIGFEPPLYIGYKSGQSPQAYPYTPLCKWAGLEDVRLMGFGYTYPMLATMPMTLYCWVKNVYFDQPDRDHLWLSWCYRNEVRGCTFNHGKLHGPGEFDDTLRLAWKACANLIEDNIFWRCHTSIMLVYASSGNVFAYNYSTNSYHENDGAGPVNTWMIQDFCIHGAHPVMNLWEGNVATQFNPDSVHGSSSHNTTLRNRWIGKNFYCPPRDTSNALDCATGFWETGNPGAVMIDATSKTNNLIGDLVGLSGDVFINIAPTDNYSDAPIAWVIGYEDDHSPKSLRCEWTNTMVWNSTILHGNRALATNDVQWDTGISDHSIPNSYYLSSKPSWWGCNQTWPPVDPSNPSAFSITNLPAAHRFLYGTNLPNSGCDQSTPRTRIRGIKIRR